MLNLLIAQKMKELDLKPRNKVHVTETTVYNFSPGIPLHGLMLDVCTVINSAQYTIHSFDYFLIWYGIGSLCVVGSRRTRITWIQILCE